MSDFEGQEWSSFNFEDAHEEGFLVNTVDSSGSAVRPKGALTPSAKEFQPKGLSNHPSFVSESESMFSTGYVGHPLSNQLGRTQSGMTQNSLNVNAAQFLPQSQLKQLREGQVQNSGLSGNTASVLPPALKSWACKMLPRRKTWENFYFLPDDLKAYFAKINTVLLEETIVTESSQSILHEVPKDFHSVKVLDNAVKKRGSLGSTGFPTTVFKVTSATDGFVYCMRRVDNVNIPNLEQYCTQAVKTWSRLKHPNVVPLRDCFSKRNSVFFLHEYIPGGKTVGEFIVSRGAGAFLKEDQIWSITIQLLTGLQSIHARGSAIRALDLHKVLISGRFRVRLGSVGLATVLSPENLTERGSLNMNLGNSSSSTNSAIIKQQQQQDLMNLGRVLLAISSMSVAAFDNIDVGMQGVKTNYSPALVQFLQNFFARSASIESALSAAAQKVFGHLEEVYSQADSLEEYLCKQMECERLFKLLMKLNFVTNRPELDNSSGDTLVLKLFIDYLFHQTNAQQQAAFDLDFVFASLNKLDVGVNDEKLLLTSAAHDAVLVLTYFEIKLCLDNVYADIMKTHTHNHFHANNSNNNNASRGNFAANINALATSSGGKLTVGNVVSIMNRTTNKF